MRHQLTRRDFLKKAASAAQGSPLLPSRRPEASSAPRRSISTRPPIDLAVVTGDSPAKNCLAAVEALGGFGKFVRDGRQGRRQAEPGRIEPAGAGDQHASRHDRGRRPRVPRRRREGGRRLEPRRDPLASTGTGRRRRSSARAGSCGPFRTSRSSARSSCRADASSSAWRSHPTSSTPTSSSTCRSRSTTPARGDRRDEEPDGRELGPAVFPSRRTCTSASRS